MRMNLFGGFRLTDRNGTEINIPQKRGRALLAYLALKDSQTESREYIVDLLWPDRFKKQAQSSLRQVLYMLRKISSDEPLVFATRQDITLGPAIQETDIWAFNDCIQAEELGDAEQALALHQGRFLDGPVIGPEPFQQWVAIQQSRMESKLEHTVLAATAADQDRVRGNRDVEVLDELVRISPMCAPAVLRAMEIDANAGNVAEALLRYERYVRYLRIQFDDTPPAELIDAFEVLKTMPAKRSRFAAPKRRIAMSQKDPWQKSSRDAPIVAVLPFRYLGTNDMGAAMAAVMCEDIAMMLSGCRWFRVLSRSATHSFQVDQTFIPKDFVNRTGADYLVYGAVIDQGNEWSVTVELADAESGLITWAKRYTAGQDDIKDLQSELSPLIVSALDPAISESEQNALRKPSLAATGSSDAYQHLVDGYQKFYAGNLADAEKAFRDATELDRTYAHAFAMRAVIKYYVAQMGRGENWRDEMKEAEKLARRALKIDPSETKACVAMGLLLDWQGQHDKTLGYLKRAEARNPSFAHAATAWAYHAVMTGAFDEAHTHMQRAMRLRVGDNGLGFCLPAKALADLHLGNDLKALEAAHWAARMKPDFWLVRQVLAAALYATGDKKGAKDVVDHMRKDFGGLSCEEFVGWFPYRDPGTHSPIAETLKQCGW